MDSFLLATQSKARQLTKYQLFNHAYVMNLTSLEQDNQECHKMSNVFRLVLKNLTILLNLFIQIIYRNQQV
jgi:hypothetical protein